MARRALLPVALLAAALCAAPAGAQAPPPAKAVLAACDRGLAEEQRNAVFEGRMGALAGAERMQMRFTLQVQLPGKARWSAVAAPGWGGWVTADPGVARYVYAKRVERLAAPAAYRVVVRFRWLDAAGGTVARSRSISRACRQPDPRPDLEVRSVNVTETADPARRSYLVRVRNTGRGAAPPSAVSLSAGGVAMAPGEAPALAPGRSALVAFEGPACAPGEALEAVADAGDDVDERDEDGNALGVPCP
jgi:hypothetical protein